MKIFKIILIGFFIILFLVFGAGVVFVKTFDVARFKPQIIEQISSALNREVAFEDIQMQFSRRGFSLKLKNFHIAEDPHFSQGHFFSVEEIGLALDIQTLILERQIFVSDIMIHSPKVRLIRNAKGELNVESLAQASSKNLKREDGKSSLEKNESSSTEFQNTREDPSSVSLPLFLIKSLSLQDGVIEYQDQSSDAGISVVVEDVDLTIDHVRFKKFFPFRLQAALWKPQQNIDLRGMIRLNPETMDISLKETELMVDMVDIPVARLKDSFVALQETPLVKDVSGRLQLRCDQFSWGEKGLKDLSLIGEVAQGEIYLKSLAVPISPIEAKFRARGSRLILDPLTVQLGQGVLQGQAQVDDYVRHEQLSFQVDIDDLIVEEVFWQDGQDVKVSGRLEGDLKGKMKDLMSPASLLAKGKLELLEGKLVEVNVLKVLLDKISLIPNLAEQLEENLPEEYKEKLTKPDTDLQQVVFHFAVKDEAFMISPLEIRGDGFGINAQGTLNFEQHLQLAGAVFISEALSLSMVESVGSLKYLLNQDNEIFIPLRPYQGPLEGLRPFPDLEYLSRKFAVQRGGEELRKVLRKVLNVEESQEPSGGDSSAGESSDVPTQGGTQTESPSREKGRSLEEDLIENILDLVF